MEKKKFVQYFLLEVLEYILSEQYSKILHYGIIDFSIGFRDEENAQSTNHPYNVFWLFHATYS